jgi:hypothetical protein
MKCNFRDILLKCKLVLRLNQLRWIEIDDDSLVTAEGNVEDDNVVVKVVLTGWDGEVGGWLAPG